MLSKKFNSLQAGMQIKFDSIREEFHHNGNKGSNVEQIIRDFLSEFLPPYNRIGEGEIIDSFDNVSNQVDVVITNDAHPFLNDLRVPSKFFIEGVACAGEVKTALTSVELITTLDKCLSFKSLSIQKLAGTQAYSNKSDIERFIDKRPFFLFSFSSQLTLDTIYTKVIEYNTKNNLDITQQIDGVFILDKGFIQNFGHGTGSFKYLDPITQNSTPGFILFDIKKFPDILLNFTSWLHLVMPRLVFFQSILHPYLRG